MKDKMMAKRSIRKMRHFKKFETFKELVKLGQERKKNSKNK